MSNSGPPTAVSSDYHPEGAQVFSTPSRLRGVLFTLVAWTLSGVIFASLTFLIVRAFFPPPLEEISRVVQEKLEGAPVRDDRTLDDSGSLPRSTSPVSDDATSSQDSEPSATEPSASLDLGRPLKIRQASMLPEGFLQLFALTSRRHLRWISNDAVFAELDVTNPQGIYSLERNIAGIDVLNPAWLRLDSGGQIVVAPEEERRRVSLAIRNAAHAPQLIPALTNYSEDVPEIERILELIRSDVETQRHFATELVAVLDQLNANGVTLDLIGLQGQNVVTLGALVEETAEVLHKAGLLLVVRAPLFDDDEVWKQATAGADHVILSTKDYNWDDADREPVDLTEAFRDALAEWTAARDGADLTVEIPGPSYEIASQGSAPRLLAFDDVVDRLAAQANPQVDFIGPGLGFFADSDSAVARTTFVQSAATVFNLTRMMSEFEVRSLAIRDLGKEDQAIWTVLKNRPSDDAAARAAIEPLESTFPYRSVGKGEVFTLAGTAQVGSRQLTFNDAGQITRTAFGAFPLRRELRRFGASSQKKLVLTFDDGPDPRFTPAILDVLKAEQVPAVFFVVGRNALSYPGIVRRIFDEGHEIGNHSFSHPNLARIPKAQMRVELSATQRVLESTTGHDTLLFRAPYASDEPPDAPLEFDVLVEASKLGYLMVDMSINPEDWVETDPTRIFQAVIDAVETHGGNIVLLHDAGGDRTPTIRALRLLIPDLRERGYEFVSVSELLGLPRSALMPPGAAGNALVVQSATIGVYGTALRAVSGLLITALLLGIARIGVIMFLAGLPRNHRLKAEQYSDGRDDLPMVSVIIPAFNEGKVILRTVQSVLASHYPKLDVIVVDDGSTDGTALALESLRDDSRLRVHIKRNAGKASALNFGIGVARGEVLACLDADTLYRPDTISKMVHHFRDPRVGAVAGNAKVGNRVNILTRLQALEYVTAQNLDRRAFEAIGGITVVPGAVGAWRRSAVEAVGGYSSHTLAEDADLTIALVRQGWKIVYEPDAIARTEAPESVAALAQQRFRWSFGHLQVMWKHRRVFTEPRSSGLCFGAFPHMLLFQFVLPLLAPIADLAFILAIAGMLLDKLYHPDVPIWSDGSLLIGSYLLFVAVDMASAVIALIAEKNEQLRLLLVIPLQRFFYRQVLYFVLIRAIVAAIKGKLARWDKLERYATVATN